MKHLLTKQLIVVLCLAMIILSHSLVVIASETPINIVIVGDSTASHYDNSRAPRKGWAQTFQQFFTDQVVIKNHAASGRSTKSFINEGRLTTALRDLKAGDYLFIQFGHNDAKSDDPARYTEPFTTYKEHLKVYIDAAWEKGAHPILLTPVERRGFNSDETVKASHKQYPAAMIELAKELNVPVIDITSMSQALFYELGPEKTKDIFLWLEPGESPNYPDGVQDNTHFQEAGAIEIGKLVIQGLIELNHPLTQYLK